MRCISYKNCPLDDSWDAIVVGSGIGGLASAALLSRYTAKRVLVLERHYVAGGYTHVFHRPSYEWDVGFHYIGQVHDPNSQLRRAFDLVTDAQLDWAPTPDVYDRLVIGLAMIIEGLKWAEINLWADSGASTSLDINSKRFTWHGTDRAEFFDIPTTPHRKYHMLSYDLSNHDLLEREVKRLPLQAQLLFSLEAPFLKRHGVSDSCSLLDIGCGDGSWMRLFRAAFPNSATTGLDRSPEILACARKQNPGARFVLVDEKNISEVLLTGDFNVALLRFSLQHMSPDTITRILSTLRSRKAPTRVIAIDGDDHSFVFRPTSDAIQALLNKTT
jgi:hypothetical protein